MNIGKEEIVLQVFLALVTNHGFSGVTEELVHRAIELTDAFVGHFEHNLDGMLDPV